MKKKDIKVLSEHIFELRYKVLAQILDIRGILAENMRELMNFVHWRITENRIELRDSDEQNKESGFISYKNCGYVILRPDTRNFFQDKAIKFLKNLLSIDGFILNPITRIGVRSTFIIPYEGSFDSLCKIIYEKFYVDKNINQLFNAEIVDVGASLNFKSKIGFYNTTTGPMKKDQMKQFLKKHDDLPEISLFFDIDYFKNDLGKINENEIYNLIKRYSTRSWEIMDNIKPLIFE